MKKLMGIVCLLSLVLLSGCSTLVGKDDIVVTSEMPSEEVFVKIDNSKDVVDFPEISTVLSKQVTIPKPYSMDISHIVSNGKLVFKSQGELVASNVIKHTNTKIVSTLAKYFEVNESTIKRTKGGVYVVIDRKYGGSVVMTLQISKLIKDMDITVVVFPKVGVSKLVDFTDIVKADANTSENIITLDNQDYIL